VKQKGELTMREAAEIAGVHIDTIRCWQRRGLLPGTLTRASVTPSTWQSVLETHPHLQAEFDAERSAPFKLEELSAGSGWQLWWRCAQGHSWRTPLSTRTRGSGCPACAYAARGLQRRHGELTMEEAGKLLGLSKATVWRRIRDGVLPDPLTYAAVVQYRDRL
jgi:hypothetical protein